MIEGHKHSVENRIVSISQPHICPIIRGKANAKVKFGAKVGISVIKSCKFLLPFFCLPIVFRSPNPCGDRRVHLMVTVDE